jgi:hypothetical protein
MDGHLVELVEPAGVVEVAVRRDRDDRPLEELGELLPERHDPEPGVDQRVPLAPADEEQVRAEEGIDVGLRDPDEAVVDHLVLEPAFRHAHGRMLSA